MSPQLELSIAHVNPRTDQRQSRAEATWDSTSCHRANDGDMVAATFAHPFPRPLPKVVSGAPTQVTPLSLKVILLEYILFCGQEQDAQLCMT